MWNNEESYNNFSSESKVWFPFLHLKELLSDDTKSKEVLTVDNHRLLFEDFLELCEGDYVIILINSSHHFLVDPYWKEILKGILQRNPIKTRVIEKKRFFVFETIVRSNRHGNDFVNNVLNKKEILRFCSKREGSAVRFDIIDNVDATDASPYTIDIFYHEFFETLDQIQFWTAKSMKRLSNFKYIMSHAINRKRTLLTSASAGCLVELIENKCLEANGYFRIDTTTLFNVFCSLDISTVVNISNKTKRTPGLQSLGHMCTSFLHTLQK